MDVACTNCGGLFSDSEPKCPYCGMIFEPGAEMEYSNKMEDIRKNLDNVDELVVSDIKSELKRFLITFLISMAAIELLVGLVVIGRIQSQKKEKEETVSAMWDKLDRISVLGEVSVAWDKLFDEGRYDELFETVSSVRNTYSDEICSWSHYYFYDTYSEYMNLKEYLSWVKETGMLSTYELSTMLDSLFTMYVNLFNNRFYSISAKEREILSEYYDEARQEFVEVCEISPEDFESIRERLAGNDITYISYSECTRIAEERLGEE